MQPARRIHPRAVLCAAVLTLAATAQAVPVVYEGFDYVLADESAELNASDHVLNGGTGWSAKWSVGYLKNPRVRWGSLAYAGVTNTGHHGQMGWNSSSTSAYRSMSSAFGETGTTVWFGWIQKKGPSPTSNYCYASLRGGSPVATMLSVGETVSWGSGYLGRWRLKVGSFEVDSGVSHATQIFVLCRIEFLDGADTATVWINPDVTGGPNGLGTPKATWSGAGSIDMSISRLDLGGGFSSSGASASFDEFRAGATFYDAVGREAPPEATLLILR